MQGELGGEGMQRCVMNVVGGVHGRRKIVAAGDLIHRIDGERGACARR